MLKKHFILFAILLSAFGAAQAQRAVSVKGKSVSRLTVEGVLYFVGSGNQITECVLKTKSGSIDFSVVKKTQMNGFNPQAEDDAAWNLGARWRVVYHDGGKNLGLTADSVTYLGKVESITGAQKAAYDYLSLLADQKFEEAYEIISPEAKQNLSFSDFTKMYKDVSIDMRGRIICSHNDDSVELLLAPHGSDGGDLFQPAEVIRIKDKWFINRLDAFKETAKGCGGLK
jgi:hypothetical protein